ncbi:MAG: IS200/IS605 family transposase [Blastocatellales bacterium]
MDDSVPTHSNLSIPRVGFTLSRVQVPPFTTLKWAYQIHYYVCFRTHRRRACFAEERNVETLISALAEICQRHEYRLLESRVYPDHVRLLLSLRPEQVVSAAIQTVKTNASRECNRQSGLTAPLWARGYLARSVGRVPLSIVKQYLDQQTEHHGYAKRAKPPVFRYRAEEPAPLSVAHAAFELSHHLVFATRYRRGVFGMELGEALSKYWLKVAEKRGFAIDRMTILPDHAHLLVRITPKMSIAECALALLNNGQYYVGKHRPAALIEANVEQLWQASAYAGTRGTYTTALIKHWLSERE